MLNEEQEESLSRGMLYDAIASRIGHRLHKLKVQVDRLALEQPTAERAAEILQQLDCEQFGIRNHILTEDYLLAQETQAQTNLDCSQEQPLFRMGFWHKGAFASRVRGYMDPSELMGFAARGLFMNHSRSGDRVASVREIGPLRAWKHYLEASLLGRWNTC